MYICIFHITSEGWITKSNKNILNLTMEQITIKEHIFSLVSWKEAKIIPYIRIRSQI